MTEVDIEYCVPCGLRDHAMKTQKTLLEEFGQDLNGVRLQPGHGGVFKIRVDDDLVWDKDEHDGEIDLKAITETVQNRVHAPPEPADHAASQSHNHVRTLPGRRVRILSEGP